MKYVVTHANIRIEKRGGGGGLSERERKKSGKTVTIN
jgi:hypothetical protein